MLQSKKTSYGEVLFCTTFCGQDGPIEYQLRSVRKINDNNPKEQALFAELEPDEQRARRRLYMLLFSMDQFLQQLDQHPEPWRLFDEWEKKNRMNWNDWFHSQADDLENEVNDYSFEFANRSRHGWCL